MSLDYILLIVFSLFFIFGMLRGLLKQMVALAALIIGLVGAWLISSLLGYLFPASPFSGATFNAVSGTALFVLFYFIITGAGKKIIKTRALVFSKGLSDRVLGGLFSLIKALILALLVIWFYDSIRDEWTGINPAARIYWDKSYIVGWAHNHNMIASSRPMRRLKGLLVALRDPEARKQLHDQLAYSMIVTNGHYRALRDDGEFISNLEQKRWLVALQNNRVNELLRDESFWRAFSDVKWEKALEKKITQPLPPKVEMVPPPPTPSPAPQIDNLPKTAPPVSSKVLLKNGSVIECRITKEEREGILVDVFIDGGVMEMSFSNSEIQRIERPGSPVPADSSVQQPAPPDAWPETTP